MEFSPVLETGDAWVRLPPPRLYLLRLGARLTLSKDKDTVRFRAWYRMGSTPINRCMATFYGHKTLCWLVEHGWKAAEFYEDDEESLHVGDQNVIDPISNETYTVYQAVEVHKQRTGEYPDFLNVSN